MKRSFTLIETIVVVAVISLTLPVIFAIIFTLMRQQIKIYHLSLVKREGDYVINLMENTIRNRTVTLHSAVPADDTNIVCKDASSSYPNPYFFDKDNQFFSYALNGIAIASASANPDADLTSNKTVVSGFSIDCSRNTVYSPPSVSISFTIQYNTTSTRPEEIASLHYQMRIKLRSY